MVLSGPWFGVFDDDGSPYFLTPNRRLADEIGHLVGVWKPHDSASWGGWYPPTHTVTVKNIELSHSPPCTYTKSGDPHACVCGIAPSILKAAQPSLPPKVGGSGL